MSGHSTVVVIRQMHPALEGVVRLAAASVPGIDRTIVVDSLASGSMDPTSSAPIVVVDLFDGDAFHDVYSVHEADPSARVVVLAERLDPGRALDLLRLGIYAFVHTPDALDELSDILAGVARGERALPAEFERLAVHDLGRSVQRARSASGLAPSITQREREVLELLAEGFTVRQIGRRLGISPRPAEAHVAKIYRRLSVRTRLQAIARGSSLGLIELR